MYFYYTDYYSKINTILLIKIKCFSIWFFKDLSKILACLVFNIYYYANRPDRIIYNPIINYIKCRKRIVFSNASILCFQPRLQHEIVPPPLTERKFNRRRVFVRRRQRACRVTRPLNNDAKVRRGDVVKIHHDYIIYLLIVLLS